MRNAVIYRERRVITIFSFSEPLVLEGSSKNLKGSLKNQTRFWKVLKNNHDSLKNLLRF